MKNQLCFLFAFLFGCLIQGNELCAQDTTWRIIPVETEPEEREDCAFVEVDGLFYLIGGRGIKHVEVLNPTTNRWQKKKKTPLELNHFQAVAYRHEIYVVGGMNGRFPHEMPLENVYIYNPLKDEWRKGADIPKERQRGSGGTVVYKDKIYLVGGIQDGHWDGTVNWFDVFDPATGGWQTLADAPHARDHFHAAMVGHKIYVAGGRRTSFKTKQIVEQTIPEIDVYDLKKQEWATLPKAANLPTQRAGCTAVAYRGKLVVIGGESAAQESSHHEVEVLNTKKARWTLLPPLVTGRHDTQAIVYKNRFYIAAGSANRGGGPDQSSMEMLRQK